MPKAFQSRAARADLQGSWSQIASEDILAADRVVDHIIKRYQQLAAFPE